MMNQVLVSALSSLLAIARKEAYVCQVCIFLPPGQIKLTNLYTVFIKTAIMIPFEFSMRWHVQCQLSYISQFLQTTECTNVEG